MGNAGFGVGYRGGLSCIKPSLGAPCKSAATRRQCVVLCIHPVDAHAGERR